MKTLKPILFLLSLLLTASDVVAQYPPVDVGSDGSYGAINITANTTLDIPEDGIFHATTITVAEGVWLSFNNNIRNTPVYFLATGDIVINGTIDLKGKKPASDYGSIGGNPGPGGFKGGGTRSDGHGPGGGNFTTRATPKAAWQYTPLLRIPLLGGGGGASDEEGPPGGGGGGSILLASNTSVTFGVNADVLVEGGNGAFTGGSRTGQKGGDGTMRVIGPVANFEANGGIAWGPYGVRFDCFEYNHTSPSRIDQSSVGANFVIFPDPLPKLEILELAGETIDPNFDVASVQLPAGADPNTTIKIRAENFNRDQPITISIHPERGTRTLIDTTIDNSASNPVTQDFNITLPVNITSEVRVWSRSS